MRTKRPSSWTGTGALAAAIWLAVPVATGQEPDATRPATTPKAGVELESVTVEAERRRRLIDEQVSRFVYAVAGPGLAESLARWNVPVCVAAAGLGASEARFVAERVARIAADAGVRLGRSNCAPNFVVIVSPDPEALLKAWWSENHQLFNRDRGVRGAVRFIESDQPMRVWHNACNAPPGISQTAFSASGHCGMGRLGSRLTRSSVRAIYSAIVVVDVTQIEGMTYGQVADYVAMIGLAPVRSAPEPGAVPTILGLFAPGEREHAKRLTAWDQSFLRAVYQTGDGGTTEISRIKLRMSEELAR